MYIRKVLEHSATSWAVCSTRKVLVRATSWAVCSTRKVLVRATSWAVCSTRKVLVRATSWAVGSPPVWVWDSWLMTPVSAQFSLTNMHKSILKHHYVLWYFIFYYSLPSSIINKSKTKQEGPSSQIIPGKQTTGH